MAKFHHTFPFSLDNDHKRVSHAFVWLSFYSQSYLSRCRVSRSLSWLRFRPAWKLQNWYASHCSSPIHRHLIRVWNTSPKLSWILHERGSELAYEELEQPNKEVEYLVLTWSCWQAVEYVSSDIWPALGSPSVIGKSCVEGDKPGHQKQPVRCMCKWYLDLLIVMLSNKHWYREQIASLFSKSECHKHAILQCGISRVSDTITQNLTSSNSSIRLPFDMSLSYRIVKLTFLRNVAARVMTWEGLLLAVCTSRLHHPFEISLILQSSNLSSFELSEKVPSSTEGSPHYLSKRWSRYEEHSVIGYSGY